MAEKPTISVIEPLKTDLTEAEPARREEFFLNAIAGGTNGEALEPMDRPEEFLRRIAERETYQEGEINRVYDQIPVVPEAGDVGKVLTVIEGAEGEAPKWGAEDVPLPDIPIGLKHIFSTGTGYTPLSPSSYFTALDNNITGEYMEQFCAEYNTLSTPSERRDYCEQHLLVVFNGKILSLKDNSANSITYQSRDFIAGVNSNGEIVLLRGLTDIIISTAGTTTHRILSSAPTLNRMDNNARISVADATDGVSGYLPFNKSIEVYYRG